MRVQLWSYNYDPEPLGIAPVSTVLARELVRRGHDVLVVAAHPHYPEPEWGVKLWPYREVRDGVRVVRLPIWPGRGSAFQRIRQELTFTAALTTATPFLPRPDVLVAVSPSFPALGPARMFARMRRIPWVLWLHDILPDGAVASGVLRDGALIRVARRFERGAYERAAAVVVLSDVFTENLASKDVPTDLVQRIHNPVTRPFPEEIRAAETIDDSIVLCIGNIGHTQNLVEVVRRFEASAELDELGARLVITGTGVAASEVRDAIRTDRVEMAGVVEPDELDRRLARAAIGLVSSTYTGAEFNIPSKVMNYMGHGLPVVAAVGARSEVARLVEEAGCGWIAAEPDQLMPAIAGALASRTDRIEKGAAAHAYAAAHFSPRVFADQFEAVLTRIIAA